MVKYVVAQFVSWAPSRQSPRFSSKQLNSIIVYTHHSNSSPRVHALKVLKKKELLQRRMRLPEQEASDLQRGGGFWVLVA